MIPGRFSLKDFKEVNSCVEDGRIGLGNDLWGVYMYNLSEAGRCSNRDWNFRYPANRKGMPGTYH